MSHLWRTRGRGHRLLFTGGPVDRVVRLLHASPALLGIRDKFVSRDDLHKRPSELEIRQKKLPQNTPTLGERIRRDREYEFHEFDKKSGYYKGKTGTVRDYVEGMSTKTVMQLGLKQVKIELTKWKNEMMEDRLALVPKLGDTRVEWQFDNDANLSQWLTTCDSDWGEGYSSCSLTRSPTGKTIFSGELNTRVPQDGRLNRSGYCNASSVKRRKSFARLQDFEWYLFTDLVLRLRGDGRQYTVNIHVDGEFDVTWNDLWNYPLYTRGGPYWQYVKIPFAKFIFGHKGKIQDKQEKVPLLKVTGVSISLTDNIDGPFGLELDYIGVYRRHPDLAENFSYEDYVFPTKNFTQL